MRRRKEKGREREVLWRLCAYLRPYRGWLIVSLLLLVTTKVCEVVAPVALGRVTDLFLQHLSEEGGVPPAFSTLFEGVQGVVGVLVIGYLCETGYQLLGYWMGGRVVETVRVEVFEHLQRMHLGFFHAHPIGKLMTVTIHDVDNVSTFFSESVVSFLGNGLLIIAILVGMWWVDWKLFLVIALFFPAIAWLTHRFRVEQNRCYTLLRTVLSTMNTFVQEHLMGAAIVRNFGLEQQEQRQFDAINRDYRDVNVGVIRNLAFFLAGIEWLQTVLLITVFAALVGMGLYFREGERFPASLFFTYNLYLLMLFRPIREVAERYNVWQSAAASGERIFSLLDQRSAIVENRSGKVLDEIRTIAFEGVWFAYQGEEWVLRDLSFRLNRGESLAFVGATGSGKTTITKLMNRLYDVQRGVIKINGCDIREFTLASLRAHFAVVPQDPVIFTGTIGENIALFRTDVAPEEMARVLAAVQLTEWVACFPEGVNHRLSERGKALSVGEMQLLSLARALLHNGEVVVLDEATANIDSATERPLQEALLKTIREKTMVVVAHRLSTIQHLDRIVVLHQGEIAEEGSHDALLAAEGLYEKLYRLQFVSSGAS